MKFGQQIQSHLTPEWRKQYIQYEELKCVLYNITVRAPQLKEDGSNKQAREMFFVTQDLFWFSICNKELKKCSLFFEQKLAEAESKLHELEHDIEKILREETADTDSIQEERGRIFHKLFGQEHTHRNLEQLRFAFSEFYLSLLLIQNYQDLNATGFQKIMKKHDKNFQTERGYDWCLDKVRSSSLVTKMKQLDLVIHKTEELVTNKIEKGDRAAAMKRLRVQPISVAQSAWTTFRLGLYLGAFAVLFLLMIGIIVFGKTRATSNNESESTFGIDESTFSSTFRLLNATMSDSIHHLWRWGVDLQPESYREDRYWIIAMRLFRGHALLFLNCWLMGLCIYCWHSAGVNHVLIFELNPRDHLTYQQFMEIASYLGMLWAACLAGYLVAPFFDWPPLIFPLVLMCIVAIWLLNPVKHPDQWMHRSSRYWFIRRLGRCATAPLHPVQFADFYIADNMISLVSLLCDFGFAICYFTTHVDYFTGPHLIDFRPLAAQNGTSSASGITDDYTACWDPRLNWWRPVLSLLPAWIRIWQCLRRYRDSNYKQWHPHLTNCGKYTTIVFVVITGTGRAVFEKNNPQLTLWENSWLAPWLLSNFVCFCYMIYWDLWMGFSLMQPEHGYLREELAYGKKWYYYFAIVADTLLRLMMVMNISLAAADLHDVLIADTLLGITAFLECFRRFLANIFRLENEHLNNCGAFRAVRDISLKPTRMGKLELMLHRFESVASNMTHNMSFHRSNSKATTDENSSLFETTQR